MADPKHTKGSLILIKYILYAILFLFPFGQLTQIPFLSGPRIYIQDILTVFLWLVLILHPVLLRHLLPQRRIIYKLKLNSLFLPLLLFVIIALLSLAVSLFSLSFKDVFFGSLYLLRWLSYTGIALASYLVIKNSISAKENFIKGLIFAGTLSSIFGLFQYALYPDLRNLYYLGWDPHYLRVFGTFFDPNYLGLIIVLTIILILFTTKTFLFWQKIILLIINGLALALTYSRSSFIALGASLVSSLIPFPKYKKIIFTLFIIGILILFILPKGTQSEGIQLGRIASIQSRFESSLKGMSIFLSSPVYGVGFNTLSSRQSSRVQYFNGQVIPSNSASGIENSFIFILATTGILGFAAYMLFIRNIFLIGDNIVNISLGAILIHSLFNNSLFYPPVMIWLWILVGTSLAIKNYK